MPGQRNTRRRVPTADEEELRIPASPPTRPVVGADVGINGTEVMG